MDFRRESVRDLAERVAARELSARELTTAALERIEAVNPALNAFVAVDGDRALDEAAALDERTANGVDPGPLAGIPIGVKDLEDAAGFVTTHGLASMANDPPAERDSILVERLRAAGCVVVGKTNTPELGFTAQTYNPVFGRTSNPWDLERTPGGSSGGSAAAVAAGMVPLATGSDGGGSIRIPSALCGLSGMKPSLGRVPSGGASAPDWQHLSTRGPMAASIADVTLALDAVIGPDPSDLRSLPLPEASWVRAIERPHLPHKVAWSPTLGYGELDGEARAVLERAVTAVADSGVEVVEVGTVFDADPALAWFTLTSAYNLRTLRHLMGTDEWKSVDPMLAAQVERAADIRPDDLVRAEDACHDLNLRLVELFRTNAVLLCPVTVGVAPRHGEGGTVDGQPVANWVRYTYGFNMTRSPAGTVCAGLIGAGLPVGLQVVGPQHGDLVVLRTLAALEEMLDVDAVAPYDG